MDKVYDRAPAHEGSRPRPRELIARSGPSALSDAELLAALIGTGTRGKGVAVLAQELLGLIDGGSEPPSPFLLRGVMGMGKAKAAAISAALELGRRLYGLRDRRVEGPADVWPLVAHWADRKQERFIALSLNGAHEVLAARVVSIGLVNRTVVHPREVFADPITDRACAVIVAHNHPSGRLDPSPEDLDITRRLRAAGETLGISLLDHLVFSREGWLSFVERGLLEPARPD